MSPQEEDYAVQSHNDIKTYVYTATLKLSIKFYELMHKHKAKRGGGKK